MAFFSKGSGSGESPRASARPGDAQARELRVRARRRLIGALALVVAAVIIVPMLIDTEQPPSMPVSPIVVPAIPQLPDQTRVDLAQADTGNVTIEQIPEPVIPIEPLAQHQPAVEASRPAPEQTPVPTPAPAPAPTPVRTEPKPEPVRPSAPVNRTDDGAVALALLEGRQPVTAPKPAASAAASGSYFLQIAAYTTEQDAASRRSKLVEAGVSNAFVESTTTNGKTAWRLRVGPFPSREAAQAAQARVRALGYGNGFISSK